VLGGIAFFVATYTTPQNISNDIYLFIYFAEAEHIYVQSCKAETKIHYLMGCEPKLA